MKCIHCEPIDMTNLTHIQHEEFSNTYATTGYVSIEIAPYKCRDIQISIIDGSVTISGFYGYDFNDHDHRIRLMLLDGSIETFTEFSKIPLNSIKEVIQFEPNYLHNKEFIYKCSDGTVIRHNVHNTMSMWGMKMLELLEICKKNRKT